MSPVKTAYFSILITRDFFLQLLQEENWADQDPFYQEVYKNLPTSFGSRYVPLEFQLHQVLSDIFNCDWAPDKLCSYVRVKIKELFLQLHYLQHNSQIGPKNYSSDCIEKIKNARAYLSLNFDDPPTITELSRIVLLNQVQLKAGFKDLYGSTINNYVKDLRMKKAPSLLQRYSVNDTAHVIGYKSVPHFISTFKKYYGQTPKRWLADQMQ